MVAAQEFFFAGWVVFKCGGRGQDVRTVNGKHGAYVFLSGNPEHGNSSFFPPVRPADSKSNIFSFYYPNFVPSRLTFRPKVGRIKKNVISKGGILLDAGGNGNIPGRSRVRLAVRVSL